MHDGYPWARRPRFHKESWPSKIQREDASWYSVPSWSLLSVLSPGSTPNFLSRAGDLKDTLSSSKLLYHNNTKANQDSCTEVPDSFSYANIILLPFLYIWVSSYLLLGL